MKNILVKGGKKLYGEVDISSAKNAVLPIIAASILCREMCVINKAPMLEDVFVICDVLRSISSNIIEKKDKIIIDNSNLINNDPDSELVRRMRASFLIMGPMISRFGKFKISLPGGCNIGTRPIDLHLKGFSALGAEVNLGHGYVEAHTKKLVGNKIYLDFPSVGATENIMMAAVLAEGETILENAAGEPEVEDLANFLNSMGARISGAGTDTIKIIGVKELKGVKYTPIPDRIEAGTFMVAAAITRGKIKINRVEEEHLKPIIAKMREIGICMEKIGDSIIVDGNNKLKPIDIKTMPYPGFPTDMQAQMMSLLCTIKGTSIITETIFENRFMHTGELKRMGANIKLDGRSAVIEGVDSLTGCDVKATDLRAGAALIIAGLVADGCTKIGDIYHIDRGYVNIEDKFKKLGADIERDDIDL
ncbi:UDP-N-acetylglucosamine 1-carboxyvinyltransferase [Clostridium sp. ZS2-4]|uniref:UDP-N-acetylglucosamine 1-carboxyvinyltransferase n=1 Tax=Clostridium sp. ZS2-4 TaxID=2987703 RepID=UPI00227BDF58|nr:UDP-N-acetylglucosamine 1-carboxyvinyltransferase [Clostridium sp. ZS2-4]MCY6355475.1 UDP-N-acetylglucosamine 1-carboxyvinyltransferase [Clostridium sp. ZS2-4]